MMENDKVNIDEEFVESKIIAISELLEGVKVPEIMAIIGGVVMHFVDNIHEQTHCFGGMASAWLEQIIEQVEDNFPDDEDFIDDIEESEKAN